MNSQLTSQTGCVLHFVQGKVKLQRQLNTTLDVFKRMRLEREVKEKEEEIQQQVKKAKEHNENIIKYEKDLFQLQERYEGVCCECVHVMAVCDNK